MRRRLSVVPALLMLILGSLVPGLVPVGATQHASPKVLRMQWYEEFPESLEPQTNEFGIAEITLLNYEGLTRFDEELNVVPGAAESWQFSDDGKTITFRLRDNLTYSDGSPLGAERFRAAIERRCDPHLAWWGAQSLFDIVGCEELNAIVLGDDGSALDEAAYEAAKERLGVQALDERTLEFTLRHPAPYFPGLTQWIGFIPVKLEQHTGDETPEMWLDPANWIGNGPFQITEIAPETDTPHITLAANPRYWGGRPKLDSIEYVVMNYDAVMESYARGELDVVWISTDDLPALEADPTLSRELLAMPTPYVDIFNFNLRTKPFQDKRVREAFAYAFDRESHCRESFQGACTPTLSWIPSWIPGAIETDAYAFDPRKAREALAASTYGGPEALPEIVWHYDADDPWTMKQTEWLANQFRQVLDVELTLQAVPLDELEAMLDDPATWPQIAETYWYASLPDPHTWMMYWTCGSEQFAENVGYCNPAYDELVARADRELDPVERNRLAEESQRLLVADAPAIFAYTWDTIVLVKPYVTGFSRTASQYWPGERTPLTVDVLRPE